MSVVAAQLAFGIAGLILIAAWPPTSGQMMLVSLDGSDDNALVVGAAAAGARVVGPGPWAGALVVSGERSRIVAQFGTGHMVVLAPTLAGCAARLAGQAA